MKKIKNVSVRIPEEYFGIASEVGLLAIDTSGGHLTTAHLLGGASLWGLHQDYFFSGGVTQTRLGKEITDAAEKAFEKSLDVIEISEECHEALLRVLTRPSPSAKTPLHPALSRLCLPIFEAIEDAE